jgi:hypothetical protein
VNELVRTEINNITTKASGFITLTSAKLQKISREMVEVDRASQSFGKNKTQTTAKLMTLTMLSPCSPYHSLRQILAQIEKKRSALRETLFKFKKDEIAVRRLENKIKITTDELDREELQVDIEETKGRVAMTIPYIEGALKEIGSYQTAYREICTAHNIPEQWDEADMEEAEIGHHIRSAFRNGVRDIMAHGRLNVSSCEYFEQYGINPVTANGYIHKYLVAANNAETDPDFNDFMGFLDAMAEKFKDSYKEVMKRLGITTLIDSEWLYKT